MAIIEKEYLDYAGLENYDTLIKEYISKTGNSNVEEVTKAINALESNLTAAISAETTAREDAIQGVNAEIEAVKALVGPESVQSVVDAAIASVVDGAPETFDTLKEIAA